MSNKIEGPYNPKEIEEKIYKIWEDSGSFKPQGTNETYSIVIPPPNITGSLHMGHALNASVQDILIRKKRMEGRKTLWLPGTDHAGIATQNAVEKNLIKKEGKTRHDLGREKFVEKIWEWKEKYGNEILNQFKKLGCSCDWSRSRFTMDKEYQKWVQKAFLHYYKKGWIYQGEKTINWCPKCQTSLSDLELEYKEEKTKLWFIKYPISGNSKSKTLNSKQIQNSKFKIQNSDYIIVATTRPETMLGDTAVAVNPKDERYKKLIGKEVFLPIVNKKIPVIADRGVDSQFGTGAMKVTPAHDLHDFEIGEKHNLEKKQVIGPDGRMTKLAGKYAGMKIKEAREKIVEDMKKIGILEKIEPYKHNLSVCYRCGAATEPILSKQWFLKMKELAKKAAKAVKSGKVVFHPKKWEKNYLNWLKPEKDEPKDWCISRQLWWGHQLPVFYCDKKQKEFSISNFQFPNKSQIKNSKNKNDPENLEIRNSDLEIYVGDNPPENYIQVSDVLDTWFSSALWPFATMNEKDLKEFYPTNTLSTARDIINLWVARMVFSGLEFTGHEPFKDVIIHPTILTKEGKRMSKSLGTGIDPMKYVEQYGADATRFGLIWQIMGSQDIHWAEEHVIAGKKFCNKLWNIARFVLTQNENFQPIFPATRDLAQRDNFQSIFNDKISNEDEKILEQMKKLVQSTNQNIESFKFGQALRDLYEFIWHEFADKYIEYSKTKDDEETKQVLAYVLTTCLKLLHPFMPHITEEIWSKLPMKDKKLLIVTKYPQD